MLTSQLTTHIDTFWDREILPALQAYIRIPNESPLFDPDWQAHGHMQRAVALVADWIRRQQVAGGRLEVLQDGDRTPLLLLEFPGSLPDTVVMYGHLDKQPPMVGWRDDLDAWTPHLDAEGRLYGRGAADDGYAVFAALATVKALKDHGQPHGRIVILIECSEESGSCDLAHYIDTMPRARHPSLVICLTPLRNYEQLWSTTAYGAPTVNLTVKVLREGGTFRAGRQRRARPFMVVRSCWSGWRMRTGAIRLQSCTCPFRTAHSAGGKCAKCSVALVMTFHAGTCMCWRKIR
jgi:acetylornithine deacetylase/succinyl-diaminopimelate desuccinylase-like protein